VPAHRILTNAPTAPAAGESPRKNKRIRLALWLNGFKATARNPSMTSYRPKFSIGWCILVAVLHAAGTIGLCLLNFLGGMSAFTYGNGNQGGGLLWVWTPLAMSAWNPNDMSNDDTLKLLGLLWSVIVGLVGGFLIPFLRRNIAPRPIPHSDVEGTPWEHDPSHTSGKSVSQKDSRSAEQKDPDQPATTLDSNPDDW
jgi:hypothetical protein